MSRITILELESCISARIGVALLLIIFYKISILLIFAGQPLTKLTHKAYSFPLYEVCALWCVYAKLAFLLVELHYVFYYTTTTEKKLYNRNKV